jgi:acetyl esterase/lipase
MKRIIHVEPVAPQYSVITNITFAQTDAWFGHTTQDLRMDLIYPEDTAHDYPCIVWICGGAWQSIDKSAHLVYLSKLARAGFVVASVQYRTSNEAKFPAQLCDVKAAIRYLRAHAARYHIDEAHIGVMGESAGGYLTCMAALCDDPHMRWENIFLIPAKFRQRAHGILRQTSEVFYTKTGSSVQHPQSHC